MCGATRAFEEAQALLSWRSSDSIPRKTSLVPGEELCHRFRRRARGTSASCARATRPPLFARLLDDAGANAPCRARRSCGHARDGGGARRRRSSSASPPSRGAPGGASTGAGARRDAQGRLLQLRGAGHGGNLLGVRRCGAHERRRPGVAAASAAAAARVHSARLRKVRGGPHAVRRVLQTEGRETVASPPIIRLPSSSLLGQRVQSYPNLASEAAMEDEEEVVVREDVAAPLPRHLHAERRRATSRLGRPLERASRNALEGVPRPPRRRASSGVVNGVATSGGASPSARCGSRSSCAAPARSRTRHRARCDLAVRYSP